MLGSFKTAIKMFISEKSDFGTPRLLTEDQTGKWLASVLDSTSINYNLKKTVQVIKSVDMTIRTVELVKCYSSAEYKNNTMNHIFYHNKCKRNLNSLILVTKLWVGNYDKVFSITKDSG